MKYKKIYEVLEQRRSSSPDFRYSDYSGWRSYYRSYMDRQRPLWIVAEDPSAGRRLWITQERSQLSITVGQWIMRGEITAMLIPFPVEIKRICVPHCTSSLKARRVPPNVRMTRNL